MKTNEPDSENTDERLSEEERNSSDSDDKNILSKSDSNSNTCDDNEFGPSRAGWNDASTRYLISLYKENSKYVGKNKTFGTYKELWAHVAKEMMNKNYMFTSSQIKQKWDALIRSYKHSMRNFKTPHKKKVCSYLVELNEIFKKRNMLPEVLDWDHSEIIEIDQPELLINNTTENASRSDSPLKKITELLQEQHRERMRATEKWRREKMIFKRKCEENRHRERMLLIEALMTTSTK